ncbi:hypothetical protein MGU_02740 [Metarhizium guizhouense ARSEF 977]|uniref:Uncharacterized protein n=1 Tax=Metarhizium guizhouense (strain ARSEF 977) TaxID=1276136 RepID=A0A0B4GRW1_METGA|nr:hypothetical protein MGU_02740 [Metarhizium guizhouense ARSEF 977]
MDASRSRAHSQVGKETPRLSSPVVEEVPFDEIFDWALYCESTEELEPSRLPGRQTPGSLSKLITQFTPTSLHFDLDNFAIDDLRTEFYRMKAPFRSDDDTATTSDYSGHSPPELIQGGGSTSPSDHSGSVFLDHAEERPHHSDVTLQEVQAQDDEWTYPQTDLAKAARRGYPSHILVRGDYAGLQTSKSAGTKRRRSSKDVEKRPRQLVDPVQTADVRKSGACVPCRVTKTRCHDSGVCPTCRKAFPKHSHLVCTRMTPAMAWPVMAKVPDFWSSYAAEEQYLCSGPRFYTGSARDISIFFSKDTTSSSLHATVQAYRPTNNHDEVGSPRTVAFPREKVPSHPKLQRWVEDQIKREHGPQFSQALQNFLLAYSKEGLKKLPKYDLVRKVHKMNCFFRIWKMPSFWCRDPSKNIANLPVSVQAQLRSIARKALDLLEHDVLKLLDDCLSQQGSPKAEERVAIWVSMWQLMLMYRELLAGYKIHLGHMMQDPSSPDEFISSQTHQYQRLVDNFYPLLTIFYHYQFRTKKSIELSFEWLDGISSSYVPREDKELIRRFGHQLLASRKDLYNYIKSTSETDEVDNMLWTFVVEHEIKKLNARKRNPKGSTSKSKKSHRADDEYDDE